MVCRRVVGSAVAEKHGVCYEQLLSVPAVRVAADGWLQRWVGGRRAASPQWARHTLVHIRHDCELKDSLTDFKKF